KSSQTISTAVDPQYGLSWSAFITATDQFSPAHTLWSRWGSIGCSLYGAGGLTHETWASFPSRMSLRNVSLSTTLFQRLVNRILRNARSTLPIGDCGEL